MPVSRFFSAAFHLADDVFTNQANGLVQIASEVVERTQGHHAGGEVGDGEMKLMISPSLAISFSRSAMSCFFFS